MHRHIPVLMLCFLAIGWSVLSGCSKPSGNTDSQPNPNLSIRGKWEGTLTVQPTTALTLMFSIQETDNGYSSTLSVSEQGVKNLAVASTTLDSTGLVTLSIKQLGASFTGKIDLSASPVVIIGEFKQSGATFPLTLSKVEDKPWQPTRPQDPVPPFPYVSEEVHFTQEPQGFTLAGTLTRPFEPGQYPAVVLVSGSGSQNRDEEILGHRPFLVLADTLTRAGIVVLRYDDRGFASSQGDASQATTLDLAKDAQSAFNYLGTLDCVDQHRKGILGHSEGGLIAPILAQQGKDVAFIVLMAAPGTAGETVLIDQSAAILQSQGAPDAYVAQIRDMNRAIYELAGDPTIDTEDKSEKIQEMLMSLGMDSASAQSQIDALLTPWFQMFLRLDPADYLREVDIPVLVLNGTKDTQISSSRQVPAIETALLQAGNQQTTTIVYEGLNHLFQPAQTGSPDEYGNITTTIDPQVLTDIRAWILQR